MRRQDAVAPVFDEIPYDGTPIHIPQDVGTPKKREKRGGKVVRLRERVPRLQNNEVLDARAARLCGRIVKGEHDRVGRQRVLGNDERCCRRVGGGVVRLPRDARAVHEPARHDRRVSREGHEPRSPCRRPALRIRQYIPEIRLRRPRIGTHGRVPIPGRRRRAPCAGLPDDIHERKSVAIVCDAIDIGAERHRILRNDGGSADQRERSDRSRRASAHLSLCPSQTCDVGRGVQVAV